MYYNGYNIYGAVTRQQLYMHQGLKIDWGTIQPNTIYKSDLVVL